VRHYAVQLDVAAAKDASELYRPRVDARDSQKRVGSTLIRRWTVPALWTQTANGSRC
jgi:hypothetical protein